MTNHDALIEYAKSIDDAAKMLCVATKDQHVPAELLHDLAGFLGSAMYRLGKLCPQLSGGARTALAVNEVYDRNRDPAESIGFAIAWLQQAAESAAYTGHCLAAVQTAVDAQGTITARPPQTVPETPAELMAWLADGDTIQPMQPRPETAADVAAAGLACSRCGTVLETRDGTVACPNGHSQDGNGPA